MGLNVWSVVATCVLLAPPTALEPIRVSDRTRGCFHRDERSYTWEHAGDDFVRGRARVSASDVAAIRAAVLASRREPSDPLARLGFTSESLAAHRTELLGLIVPPTWRDSSGKPLPLPADLEPLLAYERLAGPVRDQLLGEGRASTTTREFTVELPGDPHIRVHAEGLAPGMLPWSVTVGTERWTTSDPGISAAMRRLADPEGPSAGALDGTSYWTEGIWEDASLWERLVGDELVRRLAERQAPELPGFADFDRRFVVVKTASGAINMQPESAFYEIAARKPQLVDSAWWWNPLQGGARARTWADFLQAFDAVAAAAARQSWLAAWKASGPDRHVEAHIVGVTPRSETMIEMLVQPGWEHAGFHGTPEIELVLRRGGEWCGTIYLSYDDRRAFIATAHPAPGSHWYDSLDLAFHPNADPPTYGLVDESGRSSVRQMPRRPR